MSLNKKSILLVLAGILVQVLEFTVVIGNARIDIFSDIIAYGLILAGVWGLTERNMLFKKSRAKAIQGLVAAILIQVLNFIDVGEAVVTLDMFTKGIATIFSIYFTYYFTEALMLESKLQEKAALTRSFRITWSLLGVFIFVYYIAVMLANTTLMIFAQVVVIMCAVYYATTVINTCKQLYMEGLPKRLQQ